MQGAGVSGGGAARPGLHARNRRGRARGGAAVLRGGDAGDAAAGYYGEPDEYVWKNIDIIIQMSFLIECSDKLFKA